MLKSRAFAYLSKALTRSFCRDFSSERVIFQRCSGSRSTPSAFRSRMDIVPLLEYEDDSSLVKRIERFGEYVVRQLQIPPKHATGPALAQAADDYITGDKSKSDKSTEKLISLVCSACPNYSCNAEVELANALVAELDACMMSYFAFHWKSAPLIIEQILNKPTTPKQRWKDSVLAATRSQRIQRVMEKFRAQREMSFLLEQLRALKAPQKNIANFNPSSNVSDSEKNSSKRNPVLLLMGGGMGAGKSTVVKEVMKSPFWSKVGSDAVVVEADAFKNKDVIFKTLSSGNYGDITQAAELVHESSTKAASSMLVTALNEGRDVIFDGTMSWKPFVLQTIQMARKIHKVRFRLGPGYQEFADGTVSECYWLPVDENDELEDDQDGNLGSSDNNEITHQMNLMRKGDENEASEKVDKLPYKIELVGVVCDAQLAVARGMRRTILTGRGVPVHGQLRSHKLFASCVEEYCKLVDKATIFSTNAIGGLPEVIASKERLEDPLFKENAFSMVEHLAHLNEKANNVCELFPSASKLLCLPSSAFPSAAFPTDANDEKEGKAFKAFSVWENVVKSPSRLQRQKRIRDAFSQLQACAWIKSGKKEFISFPSFSSISEPHASHSYLHNSRSLPLIPTDANADSPALESTS